MIGTLPATANPRAELRERLQYLLNVEIPRLEAEAERDSDLAFVALGRAQQEVHDNVRLEAELDAGPLVRTKDDIVRLNDCVTIRARRSRKNETLIIHEPELQIRAQGFISVRSPLGAALMGRRVGDSVEVRAPDRSLTFRIEEVRRA